jgi:hypothetical protein
MPASAAAASPDTFRIVRLKPQVPVSRLLGQIVVLDANLLTNLRNPTRLGPDWVAMLNDMREPKRRGHVSVALLPAIAEMHYRMKGMTPARILEKRDEWLMEHFEPHGVHETLMFSLTQGYAPSQTLFEVLYRVLLNFWSLHVAHRALERYSGPGEQVAAVQMFLDEVQAIGQVPTSKLPWVAIGTALAGNDSALQALHVAGGPTARMNGGWDMMHWHTLAQLFLKSNKSLWHPCFATNDPAAASLFKRFQLDKTGTVRLTFASDEPILNEPSEVLTCGIAALGPATMDSATFIDEVQRKIGPSDRCAQFEAALRLLESCADESIALRLSAEV